MASDREFAREIGRRMKAAQTEGEPPDLTGLNFADQVTIEAEGGETTKDLTLAIPIDRLRGEAMARGEWLVGRPREVER